MRLGLIHVGWSGLAKTLRGNDGLFAVNIRRDEVAVGQFIDQPGPVHRLWLGENPRLESSAQGEWIRSAEVGFRTGNRLDYGSVARLTFLSEPPEAS